MLKSSFTENLVEAGCDEAGRGCLAGPVFAAAVILPRGFTHTRINDSKKLSPAIRNQLRTEIEASAIAWAVAMVDNTTIDKINILKASILAMHRAVDQLGKTPALLLVDGNRFIPYKGIAHQCIVKGDGMFFSIAAASILAKTYRDEYMLKIDREHPGYGWHQNKGYATLQHREAIARLGITGYHRKSFLKKINLQAKLDF